MYPHERATGVRCLRHALAHGEDAMWCSTIFGVMAIGYGLVGIVGGYFLFR